MFRGLRGCGVDEVGVFNAARAGGTRLAPDVTVRVNGDITEPSLWRAVGIFGGNSLGVSLTLEGEDHIFPGPVFEGYEIEQRCLVVVTVTLFLALADETCVVVSLLNACPS